MGITLWLFPLILLHFSPQGMFTPVFQAAHFRRFGVFHGQ
jgi:hypothetical protein